MEKNSIKEGTLETNDCVNIATKSFIDVNSTEFVSAVEKNETDKCRHFSIRGYVAEIRKKDWKISWPFFSVGDNEEPNKQADMLPPLNVPEFRWWGCPNCVRESGASDDAEDIRVTSNSFEEKISGKRKANNNSSVDVICSECYPLTHPEMKERVANIMSDVRDDDFTSRNFKNSAVREVDQTVITNASDKICGNCEIYRPGLAYLNGKKFLPSETMNLNSGGPLVKLVKLDSEIIEVHEFTVGGINKKCEINSSTQKCQMEKLVSTTPMVANTSEQQRNMENEVLDSLTSDTRKLLSVEFDENDDEDKGSANLHDGLHSNQCGAYNQSLNCKKPKKVRLLKDIIACGGKASTEVTQTKATYEAKVVIQENARTGATLDKNKRKALRVEEWGQIQKSCSKKETKRDKENNSNDLAIANSKSVNDPFDEVGLHSGFKRKTSEDRIKGKLIQSKEKFKKPRMQINMASTESERSSQLYTNTSIRSTETETLPAKTAQDTELERGVQTSLSCFLAKGDDSILTLQNSKTEVPLVQSGIASLMRHHKDMPRENQESRIVAFTKPDEFSGICANHGLKSEKATFGKGKMSEVQGGASPIGPKDSLSICNFGNKKDVQCHSKIIGNQSSKRTTVVNELEPSDEIPFEILELLAKNRHERRILDAEKTNPSNIFEKTKYLKNGDIIEFSRAREIGMSKYLLEKNPKIRKSLSRKGEDIAVIRPVEEKFISCPSHQKQNCRSIGSNINYLEKSHKRNGSFSVSNSLRNCSSGNQFAEAGSSWNFSIPRQNGSTNLDISKKINTEQSCACTQKKIGYWPELAGPLDSYTSETMPAMQLLQLMDSGIRSPVSCDVGFSVQGDSTSKRNSGITGLISEKMAFHTVKSQREVKMVKKKSFCSATQARDCRLHEAASGSGKIQERLNSTGLKEGFDYTLNSLVFPLKPCLDEDFMINGEANKKVGTIGFVKGRWNAEICSFNRNPADFSSPEAGNDFMIGFGALKCRKGISKRGRPRLRMMKLLTLKEPAQN